MTLCEGRRSLLVVALAAVLALGACADEDAVAPPSNAGAGGAALGPGLSVAQARASRLDGPLLVHGYLFIEGARVRLCDALLESFPPQCGAPALEVRGLDSVTFVGLDVSGGVRWSAQPRPLLGEVHDGVLTLAATSKG